MKTKIHKKDEYCAGPNCDCGYKSEPKTMHTPNHTPLPWNINEYGTICEKGKEFIIIFLMAIPVNLYFNWFMTENYGKTTYGTFWNYIRRKIIDL